jgi:hypothetical protein
MDDYSINLYPNPKQVSKIIEIPHIETRWTFSPREMTTLNLYPSPKQISKVLLAMYYILPKSQAYQQGKM